MVADMSYSTVSNVIDSWERIRRMENYQAKVGCLLFQEFFDLEPDARRIFGFRQTQTREELIVSKRFSKHAQYFIEMIDKALDMIGPDIEMLTDILLELGQKHVSYGVRPEYFPSMGKALISSIETTLGPSHFTPATKDCWVEVYGALSYDMIRGQKLA